MYCSFPFLLRRVIMTTHVSTLRLAQRVTERPNVISGLFKFEITSTRHEDDKVVILTNVANDWSATDKKWQRLYVRKCSKTQYGIGFEYLLEGTDYEKDHKKFFHKMTDQLKREFGNDFVGWDMASPTWMIETQES